jgi:hypothetical protein
MISVEFRDWVNDKVIDYLPKNSIRTGDKINCRCPLCGDSKKNVMKKRGYYYLKTASYHCFNCDASLTGMKLLEHLSGSDYTSLRNEYMKMMYDGKHFRYAIAPSSKDKKDSILFDLKNVVKPEWKKPLSDKAKAYLSNRKIFDAPFLKDEFYSYFTKKGDEYILIPWKLNGYECYFQLNDFEKHNKMGMKYIFPKNMDKMIYGLDNIDLSKNYIIITEGVYDSLYIPNAICVGGRFLTEKQHQIIKKRFPKMDLVYSYDNDKAGLESMAKVLSDKKSCNDFKFFKWFSDDTKEKDINDYILAHNDVNIFKNDKYVESCIIDPIIMKMWLMKKGYLK